MASSSLPLTDLIVLGAYFVGIAIFGSWFLRRSRTAGEYMTAGRDLPGWALGLSIFGTYLSSNTFLGVPGKAFGGNWNAFVFSLSIPAAAFVAVRWFVPFYRNSGEVSAFAHLEKRFGAWARTYAVVCYLITEVARVGTILFGTALGVQALTGWSLQTLIIIDGVIVTIYTLLGGIRAVVWTDVVESIILIGGAIALFIAILLGMPEGPSQAFTIAAENNKFSLGAFSAEVGASTFWVVLLYGFFTNLNNFGIDQNYVQRYVIAESSRAAAKSVWLGGLLYVPVSLLFFMIGSSLFSFYSVHGDMRAELETQRTTSSVKASDHSSEPITPPPTEAAVADRALPHFIGHRLRYGFAGLIVAAIFSAAMSTLSSCLNSSATVFLCDIWRRYFNPGITDTGSMRVLHIATFISAVAGTAVALAMIGIKSILDTWWMISGMIAGATLGLFLLGMTCKRAGPASAGVGVVAGLLIIAWMTLSPGSGLPAYLQSPFHPNLVIVVGTLAILGVGTLASRWSRPDRLSPRQ
jgi:SSS family solute:Na+ symporter